MIRTLVVVTTFLLASTNSLKNAKLPRNICASTICHISNGATPTSIRNSVIESSSALMRRALLITSQVLLSRRSAGAMTDVVPDVGIDLNSMEPAVTDTCFMDLLVGNYSQPQRIEISVYGDVTPMAAANFKALCTNELGWGYKGSDIFRIISTFSVQGGNIGQTTGTPQSQLGKCGRSGLKVTAGAGTSGQPFPADNYKILHSYKDAGVISMMKDMTNKGLQDSRFFITTSPDASWADGRYCAFGRVSKGMDVVQALQLLPVQAPTNYPLTRVRIVDSGCY